MGRVLVSPAGRPHAAVMVHSHHLTRKEAENTLLLIIEARVKRLAGVGDLLERSPNFSKAVRESTEPIERRWPPALTHVHVVHASRMVHALHMHLAHALHHLLHMPHAH